MRGEQVIILIGCICVMIGFIFGIIASEKLVKISSERLKEAREIMDAAEIQLDLIEKIIGRKVK